MRGCGNTFPCALELKSRITRVVEIRLGLRPSRSQAAERHLIAGSEDAVSALRPLFAAEMEIRESFKLLCLDHGRRVKGYWCAGLGGISATHVDMRLVLAVALKALSPAIVIAHNHPSGCPEPSRADQFLTSTLRTTLALVDVKVLDHLIVGRLRVVSMAERGMV